MDFESPIDAEEFFYSAFSTSSVTNMDRVWGHGFVVCIHPGASLLVGRESVMDSWAKILTSNPSAKIGYEVLQVTESGDLAIHVVEELITLIDSPSTVSVVATNIYQRQSGGWKMIEHHASQPMVRRSPPTGTSSTTKRVLQ